MKLTVKLFHLAHKEYWAKSVPKKSVPGKGLRRVELPVLEGHWGGDKPASGRDFFCRYSAYQDPSDYRLADDPSRT